MNGTNRPAPVSPCLTHSQESGPRKSSESGSGLQSVRRHKQRETLRNLRLQRVQRVLQTQREEEAHLQVTTHFKTFKFIIGMGAFYI